MKYCQNCGEVIHDNAVVCLKCGCAVASSGNIAVQKDMSVNTGLVVLSVLIPLFGFIYWPVNAKSRPKCAQACGIAALVSWGLGVIFTLIYSSIILGELFYF